MLSAPITRIGFIGTGLMGTPMVSRLLGAGFSVRVWNRSREKLHPLIKLGAQACTSAADAANGMDAVFLCLSSSDATERVLFAEEGAVRAPVAPPLLVDFSTIGPADTLKFARRLQEQCGTQWVDAPVSGGVIGAEQGRLVIFCGGAREHIAKLSPAFASFAQRYTHIGDVGAGQTLKLCNQLIVATNLAAIAEAVVLARAGGLDVSALPQALAGGFADSIPLQIFGARMVAGISTPVLGELALMLKDLRAIADLAEVHGEQLPVSAAALEQYVAAEKLGLAQRDLAALIELYETR